MRPQAKLNLKDQHQWRAILAMWNGKIVISQFAPPGEIVAYGVPPTLYVNSAVEMNEFANFVAEFAGEIAADKKVMGKL